MPTLASISKIPAIHNDSNSKRLVTDYMNQKGCYMVHLTLQMATPDEKLRF